MIKTVTICWITYDEDFSFMREAADSILSSLLSSSARYKLIIVETESKENNGKLIANYLIDNGLDVEHITTSVRGRSEALNIGLNKTESQFFARFDTRTRLEKNFFDSCLKVLISNETYGVVSGRCIYLPGSEQDNYIASILNGPIIGVGDSKTKSKQDIVEVNSVYLGVYRKDILEQAGKFPEFNNYGLSEDSYINWKIRMLGYKVIKINIPIYNRIRKGLKSNLKLYEWYGKVRFNTFKFFDMKLKLRHKLTIAFPFLSFAFLLILLSYSLYFILPIFAISFLKKSRFILFIIYFSKGFLFQALSFSLGRIK